MMDSALETQSWVNLAKKMVETRVKLALEELDKEFSEIADGFKVKADKLIAEAKVEAMTEFSVEFMKSMSDNYHQEEVSIHVKLQDTGLSMKIIKFQINYEYRDGFGTIPVDLDWRLLEPLLIKEMKRIDHKDNILIKDVEVNMIEVSV